MQRNQALQRPVLLHYSHGIDFRRMRQGPRASQTADAIAAVSLAIRYFELRDGASPSRSKQLRFLQGLKPESIESTYGTTEKSCPDTCRG